jgi:hypothetical protein
MKEERDRLKLKKTVRMKLHYETKTSMSEVLKMNREKLLQDGLSKDERYNLRRQNMLAIQEKFYDVMEAHPSIFKIPFLLVNRKKQLKDRKYNEEEKEVIDYEPEIRTDTIYTRTKTVSSTSYLTH